MARDRMGIFAKGAGCGISAAVFRSPVESKTIPAADLGVLGDPGRALPFASTSATPFFYGEQSLLGFTGRLGTVHNFQPGLGFSFRF
jgi:hypothetical protein